MPAIHLKVTPEQLNQTAIEVERLTHTLQQDFESLQNTVGQTSYYWQGQAADEYRKNFADQKDDTNTMLEEMRQLPIILMQMAGNYQQTESGNAQQASGLPDDFIDG